MTAFHSMRLSAHGAPETPNGGSDDSRLKSRISRRRQAVDWRRRTRPVSYSNGTTDNVLADERTMLAGL